MVKDIKALYQSKAEELALELLNIEFEQLSLTAQTAIYNRAVIAVNEQLMNEADRVREEIEVRKLEKEG